MPNRRVISYAMLCLLCTSFTSALLAAPPTTPADFRYKIYSGSAAELFWLRTTNVPVQGYEITRNGETLGLFDALSFFDDTLSPGIDYTYTITAVGIDGGRSGLAVVSLRPPQFEDTIVNLQQKVDSLQQEIALLESLLSNNYRSPVPQTGQKISMLPGDDGDWQTGIPWPDPRFTLNVEADEDINANGLCDGTEICNGSVTDNLTGLIWLQNANCFGERDWKDAINDANALAGDGSSNCGLTDNSQIGDWRLPNIKEILSLLDYGHAFPTALLPIDHPFIDVQLGGITSEPSRYWSSTSTGSDNDAAYSVSVSVGWVERLSVSTHGVFTLYVWPVQGGH